MGEYHFHLAFCLETHSGQQVQDRKPKCNMVCLVEERELKVQESRGIRKAWGREPERSDV